MPEPIRLHVVSPTRSVIETVVSELTGPGALGQFGILPDHAAFLTALEPGVLSWVAAGRRHHAAVRGGFAEVSENVVTVLADEAVAAEDINEASAEAEAQEAAARLEGLDPFSEEFRLVHEARRWAEAQLDAARLARRQA